MKRTIAIAGAVALMVVGTAFVVRAQTTGGTPACADITEGEGQYTPPKAATVTTPAATGLLEWDMTLAAASCPDFRYAVTVYLNSVAVGGVSPPVIASATTTGDSISNVLQFALEVNANDGGAVCVAASTFGVNSSAPTSSKSGAAFDADGSGAAVGDRDPDGPAGGDNDGAPMGPPDEYCARVDINGSGGRTAG